MSVAVLLAPAASPGRACPFCSNMGKTLAEDVAEAGLVVYAALANAKLVPDATPGQPDGTTEMTILKTIKTHQVLKGKTKVVLPRYIPAAEGQAVNYLIFAEVVDGKIDPYRGMPVDSTEFVDYLSGAVQRARAKPPEKLGFFFDYLDHKDVNISGDAYKEFAAAPYKDVAGAAKHFDPDRLIKWIGDRDTPSYRIGLYGCLLGVCGRPADAKVLRRIVDSPESRPLTGVDGLMGGYCVLDPHNGPLYVLAALSNPENDFNFRYSALRTVRFLLTELPQIERQKVFAEMAKAILIPDISDLIIDEFRKNQVWTPLEMVLDLYQKPKYNLQVVRRAVIRFAIKCPDPKAKAFIADLRKKDPQLLSDVEQILKFEEAQQAQLSTGT